MLVRTAARGLAASCLVLITALLLLNTDPVYEESHWLGAGFVFTSIAALACALMLTAGNANQRLERAGWLLGGLISACVIGFYVASRTVGLPGYADHRWLWGGIVSMAAAAVFLGLLATTALRRREPRPPYPGTRSGLLLERERA